MMLEAHAAHGWAGCYAATEAHLRLAHSFLSFLSFLPLGSALGLLIGEKAFLIPANEPVGCNVKTPVGCGENPFQAGAVAVVVEIVQAGNGAIFPSERTAHESVRSGEDSHLQATD